MGKVDLLHPKGTLKQIIKYFAVTVGCLVYGIGFQFFMFPNDIVSGGVTGIAMIINRFTGVPVGMMNIILNIPLFLVAWRSFGTNFLVGSLVGMTLSSVVVDVFALIGFQATADPMLASIIGGVIKGAGLGIVYYAGATTGGVDIIAKFLRRKLPQINFGTIILMLDCVIIAAYAIVLGKYESAMYSLIAMFVVSRVTDLVLYGMDNAFLCYIISEHSTEIIHDILTGHLHRGVTVLEGEGGFSNKPKKIILCVVKKGQLGEIKRLVRSVDNQAFFIVSDAKNVFGNGFQNIAEVK